jgi:hypothetical protein
MTMQCDVRAGQSSASKLTRHHRLQHQANNASPAIVSAQLQRTEHHYQLYQCIAQTDAGLVGLVAFAEAQPLWLHYSVATAVSLPRSLLTPLCTK